MQRPVGELWSDNSDSTRSTQRLQLEVPLKLHPLHSGRRKREPGMRTPIRLGRIRRPGQRLQPVLLVLSALSNPEPTLGPGRFSEQLFLVGRPGPNLLV